MDSDDIHSMIGMSQSLTKSIYFSARDGMSMVLYSLLNAQSPQLLNYLLNKVRYASHVSHIYIHNMYLSTPMLFRHKELTHI